MRAAFLALVLVACGQNADPYQTVSELRILAIKAERPQLLADAPVQLPLRFDALVANPEGTEVAYTWSFCPVESSSACFDFEAQRDLAGGFGPSLSELRATSLEGTATAPEYAVAPFEFAAPSVLLEFHLQRSLLGAGLGVWPSALLEVTSGSKTIRAQKRIVLGFANLRAVAFVQAQQFGYSVCPAGKTPSDVPGCLEIPEQSPNQNPRIVKVQIGNGEAADVPFEDSTGTGPWTMPRGGKIRIRPVLSDDSEEDYHELRVEFQSRQIFIDALTEQVSISWFATDGRVNDRVTWVKFTKTLDTRFDAPETPGPVTVWMVARDQRGGVDWARAEVIVE